MQWTVEKQIIRKVKQILHYYMLGSLFLRKIVDTK